MPGFKAGRYVTDLIRSVQEGSLLLAPLEEYGARSMRKSGTQLRCPTAWQFRSISKAYVSAQSFGFFTDGV
jgi:hypothetical protein